ncbi:TonB-dependent receptor [Flavobacteriaceae bacterium]|nr:TonB-dependent receptor [Flavobacteriaceae bacterium]
MKRIILTLLLIGLSNTLFAQRPNNAPRVAKIKITGNVNDSETSQPLEYATISLVNERFPDRIQGGITDAKGNFDIEIFPGKYNVTIEYIGFEKITLENKEIRETTSLGNFALTINLESLEEVELIGERTEVEIRLDKRVYNVGRDITVRGGSVTDVMDNIPAVSVDLEGNISLRGNDNVRILINGKPSGLVGLSGPAALRQLPAESIEKVEVVTSPSARYEASGTAGILNIILKKDELIGFNATFIANAGIPENLGGTATLNWRTKKLNIFSTTTYRDQKSLGGGIFNSEYFNGDLPSTFANETRDYDRVRKNYFINLGAEYYFNDKTSLTISGFVRDSNNTSDASTEIDDLNANGDILKTVSRLQEEAEEDNSSQLTANFTKKFNDDGHELVAEIQLQKSAEDEFADITNSDSPSETAGTLESQTRNLFQLDYVWPIDKNTQFEFGYRGDFSSQENDYEIAIFENGEFVRDTNLSNVLLFEQNINALYTQFGKKINKFSYLVGLRMENTNIVIDQKTTNDFKEKKYTNFFPTLNLSYEFSEEENITLGFSRRIRRPRSWSLNPFPSRSSVTFFRQGNPDLDPSYSSTFDFGYLKRWEKFTFNGSAYYQKATQVITRITEATGEVVRVSEDPLIEIPSLRATSINLAENNRIGTEFTLTYAPSRKFRLSGNFNIFNSETIGNYNNQVFDAEIVSWFARINGNVTLPKGWTAQLRGFYRGPNATAQNRSKGFFVLSGAINKDVLKKKGTLSFNASDLLNSRRFRNTTTTERFINYSEFQWRRPSYVMTFTYKINERKNDRRRRNQNYGDGGGDEFGF